MNDSNLRNTKIALTFSFIVSRKKDVRNKNQKEIKQINNGNNNNYSKRVNSSPFGVTKWLVVLIARSIRFLLM